ncbi:hypothetical protein F5B22DRAFT_176465 [Xylaria bambusicola]|uniref:uncharacterized protein n=1 Tax=Xylaria bambusicola TaxID=326684 RepID=UPI002008DB25|nr:uncharacterized protein F5B22DRAFT_176465 [Xylaria bambusicola]KAI0516709.1 hypothetical protein F5B22DRAFT_176465 [Xylaria bambusicola]
MGPGPTQTDYTSTVYTNELDNPGEVHLGKMNLRQATTSQAIIYPSTPPSPSSFPPLTSIFTPAQDCTIFEMQFCDKNACSASDGGNDFNQFIPRLRSSCYPSIRHPIHTYLDGSVYTERGSPELTYSPGVHCPHGMTTATSLLALDAVYCCYSSFNYKTDSDPFTFGSCVQKLTEGIFLYSSSAIAFGPSETDSFTSVAHGYGGLNWTGPPLLEVIADPIFLIAQRALSEVPNTGGSSTKGLSASPTQTSSSKTNGHWNTLLPGPQSSRGSANTNATLIGSIVGSIGFVLVICLGLLYFLHYRRKRMHQANEGEVTAQGEKWDGLSDKPELEGSQARQRQFYKAELDALAVRAELEGSPGEEHDPAGIGFLKPELHGTSGVRGLLGVFLKKKAELEAPSNLEAGKPGNCRLSNPAQGQPFVNYSTEPVELDSRSLPTNSNAGVI